MEWDFACCLTPTPHEMGIKGDFEAATEEKVIYFRDDLERGGTCRQINESALIPFSAHVRNGSRCELAIQLLPR